MDALSLRAGELSRSWAIAQLQEHAPGRMGEVPVAALAQEGPGLIRRLAAALACDSELAQLGLGASAGRYGQAGASAHDALWPDGGQAGAVMAAEALRGVLWDATLQELREPAALEVAELSDRLAYLCSLLVAGWVGAGASAAPAPSQELVLIVDEHEDEQASGIEIRDERRARPRLWLEAIERRLERFELDRKPFAVLLGEITELERRERFASATEVSSSAELILGALRRELGPMDHVAEERPGRYWLVVPETDALSARLLAERLAQAVRTAIGIGAAPLLLAVGIALCPDHGRDAMTLCAHADVDIHAARAAGQVVAPADDSTPGR